MIAGFQTVRGPGQASRSDVAGAGRQRPDPHPGRLGHLRARRRQRSGVRRVSQAHRRLRPPGHRPPSNRLHRPVQPRADRRRDGARADAGQVPAGRPAVGPCDLHPARAAGPSGAGPRARRSDREAGPLRDPHLQQRPLRVARAAAVRRGPGRQTARRGAHGRAGAGHAGKLLRRLYGKPRPAASPIFWSGPTRCSIASRTRPNWTRSSASICSAAGRWNT